jgi:hypothetical protein
MHSSQPSGGSGSSLTRTSSRWLQALALIASSVYHVDATRRRAALALDVQLVQERERVVEGLEQVFGCA